MRTRNRGYYYVSSCALRSRASSTSCPLTSAVRRCTATLAPAACCHFDPQSPFEPMTDWEELVMTADMKMC